MKFINHLKILATLSLTTSFVNATDCGRGYLGIILSKKTPNKMALDKQPVEPEVVKKIRVEALGTYSDLSLGHQDKARDSGNPLLSTSDQLTSGVPYSTQVFHTEVINAEFNLGKDEHPNKPFVYVTRLHLSNYEYIENLPYFFPFIKEVHVTGKWSSHMNFPVSLEKLVIEPIRRSMATFLSNNKLYLPMINLKEIRFKLGSHNRCKNASIPALTNPYVRKAIPAGVTVFINDYIVSKDGDWSKKVLDNPLNVPFWKDIFKNDKPVDPEFHNAKIKDN